MSECCNEYNCKRKKPVLVRRSVFSGRWTVVTDYTVLDGGLVSAKVRHDINDDFEEYLKSQGYVREPVGTQE